MWAQILPVISGIAIAVVGFLGIRMGRRGVRENDLIDQLQEEVKRLHSLVTSHGEQISALQAELWSFRSRELVWQAHTMTLENHLVRVGEQPATRPTELTTIPMHTPTPTTKEQP